MSVSEQIELAVFTGSAGTALLVLHEDYQVGERVPQLDAFFSPVQGECLSRTLRIPSQLAERVGADGARECLFEAARHWTNRQAWKTNPNTPELVPQLPDITLDLFERTDDEKTVPSLLVQLAPFVLGAPSLMETLDKRDLPLLGQHSRMLLHGLKVWQSNAATSGE
jgi:hypothetical protein